MGRRGGMVNGIMPLWRISCNTCVHCPRIYWVKRCITAPNWCRIIQLANGKSKKMHFCGVDYSHCDSALHGSFSLYCEKINIQQRWRWLHNLDLKRWHVARQVYYREPNKKINKNHRVKHYAEWCGNNFGWHQTNVTLHSHIQQQQQKSLSQMSLAISLATSKYRHSIPASLKTQFLCPFSSPYMSFFAHFQDPSSNIFLLCIFHPCLHLLLNNFWATV